MKRSIRTTAAFFAFLAFALLSFGAGMYSAAADEAEPRNTRIDDLTWEDIQKATDLSEIFRFVSGSGEVSRNDETGRIRLTSTGTAAALIEFAQLPPQAVGFSIEADVYMTENNHGDNAIFQVGVFSQKKPGRGFLLQQYVNATSAASKYNISNTDGTKTKSTAYTQTEYRLNDRVSVKIKIASDYSEVSYNGTLLYTCRTSALNVRDGNPFFMLRQNCTLEVENVNVLRLTDKTTEETTAESLTDVPTGEATGVPTNEATKAPTDAPVTGTPAPGTAHTETTDDAKRETDGCQSALRRDGMLVLLIGIGLTAGRKLLQKKSRTDR